MADSDETVAMAPASESRGPSVQPAPNKDVSMRRPAGLGLAIAVLFLLALVIATAFVLVATKRIGVQDMRSLLELMLGPLFALAGTALGFYFAGR
jgi:hypothetical protein